MGGRLSGSPFVGREPELSALGHALARITDGAAAAALVEGEAGIGKTRLVDQAVAAARVELLVLRGSADEFERTRPFGAIADALGLRGAGTALAPALANLPELLAGNAAEHHIIDEIVDGVHALAAVQPVAIVIDDLQWADQSSIATIAAVTRRSPGLPVGLVATMRPTPRSHALSALVERVLSSGGLLLRLLPLSGAHVHSLASVLLDAVVDEVFDSYLARTAGNPLYVTELVRALTDDNAIVLESGAAHLIQPGVPPSLRVTLLRRLSMLPPRTVDLLRTAALLGSAFSVADLAVVRSEEPSAVIADLRPALSAGFVEERGERAAFRHDLIHEALYEDLPVEARQALHRGAGRALAAGGRSALAVATQLAIGAEPGDTEALHWVLSAASDVREHSVGTAVELWQRALELGVTGEDRTRTFANLLLGLLFVGRVDEAIGRARAWLQSETDPDSTAAARYMLAMAHGARGEFREKYAHLTAIRPAQMAGHREALLQVHQAEAALLAGDGAAAGSHARAAFELAGQTNDAARCEALLALADTALASGNISVALSRAQEARALHPTLVGIGFGHPPTWLVEGRVLRHADRVAEAEDVLRVGLESSRRRGVIGHAPLYHAELAMLLYTTGRWDDALTEAETGMDIADETGVREVVGTCVGVQARIALHRQALYEARAHAAGLGNAVADAGLHGELVSWVSAELSADNGVRLSGQLACWDARASVRGHGAWRILGPDLFRSAVRLGHSAIAQRVAGEIEEFAAKAPGVPGAQVAALRARLLLRNADYPDAANPAVEMARQSPSPLELAGACEDAGTADTLREAAEIWAGLGATRDVARVDAVLRQLGVRRGRRGRRGRPMTGWGSLTASEQQVVRFVAEGISNREIASRLFISPRTVETHLRHIYAKLGVRGRVELATTSRAVRDAETTQSSP